MRGRGKLTPVAEQRALAPQTVEEMNVIVAALEFFAESLRNDDERADEARVAEAMLARAGMTL